MIFMSFCTREELLPCPIGRTNGGYFALICNFSKDYRDMT